MSLLAAGAALGVVLTQVGVGQSALLVLGDERRGLGALARSLLLGPWLTAVWMIALSVVGFGFDVPAVLVPSWILIIGAAWRFGLPRFGLVPGSVGWAQLACIALFALAAWVAWQVPIHKDDAMLNFALVGRAFETRGSVAAGALRGLVDPGHIDYPPLVALSDALLFMVAGAERARAATVLGPCAYLALLLLVVEACRTRLQPRSAVTVVAVFAALPVLFLYAIDGGADLRLTATLLALALEVSTWRGEARSALRVCVYAAACALTKNEGLPIAAATLLLIVWRVALRQFRLKAAIVPVFVLVVGAAWWTAFRASHGITSGFAADALNDGLANKLGRIPEVMSFFAFEMPLERSLGGYLVWGMTWPLVIAAALIGLRHARATLRWPVALLAVHLGLYAAVFAVTPRRLEWHLSTAAYRLSVHTVPWLLLIVVAAVSAFEQKGASREPARR